MQRVMLKTIRRTAVRSNAITRRLLSTQTAYYGHRRSDHSSSRSCTARQIAYGALAFAVGSSFVNTEQQEDGNKSQLVHPKSASGIYQKLLPCVCKVVGFQHSMQDGSRNVASGSGFVISEDGLVATNHHVLHGFESRPGTKIKLMFDDGRVYFGQRVASDSNSDIGLIKIVPRFEGEKFSTVTIGDSTKLTPGDSVTVVGCPLGGRISFSCGVLTSKYYGADDHVLNSVRPLSGAYSFLQFDADIITGNSGGPVVDREGNVVGVACASKGVQGVGNVYLGISMEDAWPIIQQLRKEGQLTRSWVGLRVIPCDRLDWELMRERSKKNVAPFPKERHSGLMVEDVVRDSAAEEAGIQPGDIIFSVNGNPTIFKGDLFAAIGPVHEENNTLRLKVFRPLTKDGKGQTLEVSLQPRKLSPK
eukprot:gb/GECG01000664.1/.p1 GENE.gb/GECG01000664.1/~~gb/GECG01000664.1/.p1  ORF type:complete len:418 (+),score=32.88 gb/GECG01000664.1/:1-1254(+)